MTKHFRAEPIDFSLTPFTTIWEVTRACDLKCVHCRAEAQPWRHPLELTREEGFSLLEQVRDLGSPVFVLTGGDPLKRPDLFDLMAYAAGLGLSLAVSPSGTPLLTQRAVERMQALGVRRMALSLDGSTAEIHDGFRQEQGSFRWTLDGLRFAQACGLSVQVNTTVTRHNLLDLPNIAGLVGQLGAAMWSVFFLVTVGRAREEDQITPQDFEDVFHFLYDLSRSAPYGVRTTAAPHFRRVVVQRRRGEKDGPRSVPGLIEDMPRAPKGVTDGHGLVFISHTGEVWPSGFLPLSAGNVRERPLKEIYRHSPLFRQIRDYGQLKGKCGVCEFKNLCAGSRARAYAVTGDFMAEEPYCVYEPRSALKEETGVRG